MTTNVHVEKIGFSINEAAKAFRTFGGAIREATDKIDNHIYGGKFTDRAKAIVLSLKGNHIKKIDEQVRAFE